MSEPTKLSDALVSVLQGALDRCIEAGNPPNQENAVKLAEKGIRVPAELLPKGWQPDESEAPKG
jgi:hypothetical protein